MTIVEKLTAAAAIQSVAVDVTKNDWHVVIKTENGMVSMLRNLPLRLAVEAMARLDPPRGEGVHCVSGSDIRQMSLLGPDGWDGCTKGPAHAFPELKTAVTDGGPNAGRRYQSGSCSLCGFHKFEWLDLPTRAI